LHSPHLLVGVDGDKPPASRRVNEGQGTGIFALLLLVVPSSSSSPSAPARGGSIIHFRALDFLQRGTLFLPLFAGAASPLPRPPSFQSFASTFQSRSRWRILAALSQSLSASTAISVLGPKFRQVRSFGDHCRSAPFLVLSADRLTVCTFAHRPHQKSKGATEHAPLGAPCAPAAASCQGTANWCPTHLECEEFAALLFRAKTGN
jgi:hypothetical protein